MTVQHTPPPADAMFLAPATLPAATAAGPKEHHPRPDPTAYLCTCGKIREACVHDEVRELWHGVTGD
jgi:hypothetical protein